MYTENDYENNDFDEYNDEREYEESFWDRNKGLIFKILIIILCVIILIWLISKLGNKNINKVESNYNDNVTAVRLASEQYFFINNKPSTSKQTILVSELENRNLVKKIVDEDGNACDTSNSVVTLENNSINYIMSIKLNCKKETDTRNYYYSLLSYACENCGGNTYMDGTNGPSVTPSEPEKQDEPKEDDITCEWSKWSTTKNYDSSLTERTRVVVKAQKENTKTETVYGEWTEFTTTPVSATDNLEVETKVDVVDNWVSKTSSSRVTESDTIRNVTRHSSRGTKYTYCPDGYEKVDNTCRKGSPTKTISTTEYIRLSGQDRKECTPRKQNQNTLVYICGGGYTYTDLLTGYRGGSSSYSYEQLEKVQTVLYRSRTKETKVITSAPTVTDYILKTEVPSGYTIVPGSERTEYSYRADSCGTK